MQNLATTAQSNVFMRVLRRWWWLPVLFGLISAGMTYAGTKAIMKPEFGSTVTLEVVSLTQAVPSALPQDANTVATLMGSSPVQALAFHRLPPTIAKLDPKVISGASCTADATDRFVACSTQSRDWHAAVAGANALAHAFLAYNHRQTTSFYSPEIARVRGNVTGIQKHINSIHKQEAKLLAQGVLSTNPQYSSLALQLPALSSALIAARTNLSSLENEITTLSGRVKISNPAPNTKLQVGPHPVRNAILGFVVGVALAAALIILLEYLDDTFRSSDEIAESLGMTVLGSVRRFDGPNEEMGTVASKRPRTAIAEAYRVIRANIQFTNVGGDFKVILVTSARDGEGKTTTANNLATTFALSGKRVLIVDADLRRPGLTKMSRMKDAPGLSTALVDPGAEVAQTTDVVGLSVVPSGPIPPNPAELLGSQRMRDWVENAADRYDLIILDTPPILSVADTRILATLADGIVLVLDPALSSRRMVRQARAAVENVGARVLGVILNRDTMRGEGYYYNYYYYDKPSGRDDKRGSEVMR